MTDDQPAEGLYVKGYLVTLRDGYEVRMAPDKTRADHYAAQNHATIEPLFVRRGETFEAPKKQEQWPQMPDAKLL